MDQAKKHHKIRMAHIVELADARAWSSRTSTPGAQCARPDIPDDFIATLKDKNVSVISTLAREEAMFAFGMGQPSRQSVLSEGPHPERNAILKTKKRKNKPTIRAGRPTSRCLRRQAQPEEAVTPGSNAFRHRLGWRGQPLLSSRAGSSTAR